MFTPSLYIGAAAGGAFGVALAGIFPSLNLRPEAYALVGMGVVVAVATNAPITAILVVFEMTNDYAIVLPLMLSVVIGSIVARRLEIDDLYSGWLRRRGERLEHGADHDVLARLRVADAYEPNPQVIGEAETVRIGDSLLTVIRKMGVRGTGALPVVDPSNERLIGIVTRAHVLGLYQRALAGDHSGEAGGPARP